MKRNIVGIFLFCLMFGSLFYVFYTKKSSWTNYALNSPTEDTVLHNIDSENGKFQEFEKLALHGETVKEMSFLVTLGTGTLSRI